MLEIVDVMMLKLADLLGFWRWNFLCWGCICYSSSINSKGLISWISRSLLSIDIGSCSVHLSFTLCFSTRWHLIKRELRQLISLLFGPPQRMLHNMNHTSACLNLWSSQLWSMVSMHMLIIMLHIIMFSKVHQTKSLPYWSELMVNKYIIFLSFFSWLYYSKCHLWSWLHVMSEIISKNACWILCTYFQSVYKSDNCFPVTAVFFFVWVKYMLIRSFVNILSALWW